MDFPRSEGSLMLFDMFKTAAWQLISQTDWMCKFILLGLFCLSIFCVAIIAFKFLAFRYQKKQLRQLLARLKTARTLNELVTASRDFKESVGGKFLTTSLNELKHFLEHTAKKKDGGTPEQHPTLSVTEIEQLEIAINQALGDAVIEEESYLPVLSISASVSTLIGLFGTVWGLIHAFIDISQEKTADIATVAPGIAEALITTLAGLVVAIPALIAFHYFASELRKIEHLVGNVSDRFFIIVQQTFLR